MGCFLVKGSTGPLRVNLPVGDGTIVQVLLNEIPDKQKIIFVLPIKVLDQPLSVEDGSDSEYLPDPLKLTIRKTRSVANADRTRSIGHAYGKRRQEKQHPTEYHQVKRQRSGMLEGGIHDERKERPRLSETPTSSEKSDEGLVTEEEEDMTIKLEIPRSKSVQPLT